MQPAIVDQPFILPQDAFLHGKPLNFANISEHFSALMRAGAMIAPKDAAWNLVNRVFQIANELVDQHSTGTIIGRIVL